MARECHASGLSKSVKKHSGFALNCSVVSFPHLSNSAPRSASPPIKGAMSSVMRCSLLTYALPCRLDAPVGVFADCLPIANRSAILRRNPAQRKCHVNPPLNCLAAADATRLAEMDGIPVANASRASLAPRLAESPDRTPRTQDPSIFLLGSSKTEVFGGKAPRFRTLNRKPLARRLRGESR